LKSNKKYISSFNIHQGTETAKKASGKSASASSSSSDVAEEIETEIESLTEVNLGSLGLRSLPVLEARKRKKNGTEVATGAVVSEPYQHRACCLPRIVNPARIWN
jgi:hypothetical protein